MIALSYADWIAQGSRVQCPHLAKSEREPVEHCSLFFSCFTMQRLTTQSKYFHNTRVKLSLGSIFKHSFQILEELKLFSLKIEQNDWPELHKRHLAFSTINQVFPAKTTVSKGSSVQARNYAAFKVGFSLHNREEALCQRRGHCSLRALPLDSLPVKHTRKEVVGQLLHMHDYYVVVSNGQK